MNIFKRISFCIILLCTFYGIIKAQTGHPMQSLGTVWKYTYGKGAINNIKKTKDGTYVAAGSAWVDGVYANNEERKKGLIVEFSETGSVIRRIEVPINLSTRLRQAELHHHCTGWNIIRMLTVSSLPILNSHSKLMMEDIWPLGK
jgi:hypothetical protein